MKIRPIQHSDNAVNREHAALGIPPSDADRIATPRWRSMPVLLLGTLVLLAGLVYTIGHLDTASQSQFAGVAQRVLTSPEFWAAVAVGFAAQAIDGALGMAYGISSTTFLIGTGASPAAASAAVHIAEVFTTGFSGASHFKLGNVDKKLFRRLVIPGVIGGVAGAYLLTSIDGKLLKPFIAAYLLILGLVILRKAFLGSRPRPQGELKHVSKLALTGGFVDAVGGGGWGPVVTSTLVGRGNDPRTTIGSVNAAEFFIALATGGAFLLWAEVDHWILIAGLIFGGLFAAPFAAVLVKKLSTRTLLWLVGSLISLLSCYNLYKALA
ncbi:sulfite exporter TauE/SafE family protein [Chitinilyticum piscinae]|uniref:Probable membrane transporter protein n=1 Tax=Chitinilyticum piscinae TaxID=2866724 RepID=A0A8J7FG41_9NEIS|nr:sulfite exporter TauE/SafE family protein [Chitinilyticum piscinae]MBE9608440.1 sulfite exporter TauE/SafE family protein [Chitinilyticum piscinae]